MVDQVELRTERLLLRPFRLEDVDDVYAYAADPEWSRFLFAVQKPYDGRDAETFVARAVLRDWRFGAMFAVLMEQRVVGGIGLSIDTVTTTGDLGYAIGRKWWGQGLIAEGAAAVIDWGFRTYDLVKVYARADERNRRSWRVMEKLGMTREGLLRSHRPVGGQRANEVVYGLLREEWEAGTDR